MRNLASILLAICFCLTEVSWGAPGGLSGVSGCFGNPEKGYSCNKTGCYGNPKAGYSCTPTGCFGNPEAGYSCVD